MNLISPTERSPNHLNKEGMALARAGYIPPPGANGYSLPSAKDWGDILVGHAIECLAACKGASCKVCHLNDLHPS